MPAMTSFKPQVALATPVNIWPLILHDYSSCCVHIANSADNIDISTIGTPIILSRSLSFQAHQRKLLEALISVSCLLSIISFSTRELNAPHFLDIIDTEGDEWGIWQEIYPQTYLLVVDKSVQNNWPEFGNDFVSSLDLHLQHWPEVFVLYNITTTTATHREPTFHVGFFCWYCRSAEALLTRHNFWGLSMDIVELSCSASDDGSQCRRALKDTVATSVSDWGARLWHYPSLREDSALHPNVDPFGRGRSEHIGMAVAAFLYRINGSFRPPPLTRHLPWFDQVVPDLIPEREKPSILSVGSTPPIKFVTLTGVFSTKSSYEGYLTPFTPHVWLVLVASAGLSLLVEVFVVRRETGYHRQRLSLSTVVHELLYRKLSSFIGKYNSPYPPALLPSQNRGQQRPSRGVMIVAAAWLIGSTALINSYGASFNSETLRMFSYETEYEKLIQLKNFMLYVLLDANECKKLWWLKKTPEDMDLACLGFEFPECEIGFRIYSQRYYMRTKVEEMSRTRGKGDHGSIRTSPEVLSGAKQLLEILTNFENNLFILCNNPEQVEITVEAIVKKGERAAFITYEYEFQYNWAIFTEIMKRRPNWKFASNFESHDRFGMEENVYLFSSGLHKPFKERFEGRLKVLVSSGIYKLWSKWQRIRFSMSGLRHGNSKLEPTNGSPGDSMSFENSAASWLFWAQSLAWLGAVIAFVAELMYDFVKQTKIRGVMMKKFADLSIKVVNFVFCFWNSILYGVILVSRFMKLTVLLRQKQRYIFR